MALPVRRLARVETPVMFVSVQDESDEIGAAWDRLESVLGSVRGRRLFGAFDDGGTYRCCTQIRDGDNAARLGLESGVIPGGWYVCATLRGPQPAAYALLTPTFAELRKLARRDATRPSIEYYRRHDRVDLLMPVTD
jgi:hypothetical protein